MHDDLFFLCQITYNAFHSVYLKLITGNCIAFRRRVNLRSSGT